MIFLRDSGSLVKYAFLSFLFLYSLHVLTLIFEPAVSFVGGRIFFYFVWKSGNFFSLVFPGNILIRSLRLY